MRTEKNIVKWIMDHLRGRGAWVVKLHGGPYQSAGLPDLLCVIDGVTLFFEVKTEIGKVTKIQTHCHEKMRQAGAGVYVVRCVSDVERIMERRSPSTQPSGWIDSHLHTPNTLYYNSVMHGQR